MRRALVLLCAAALLPGAAAAQALRPCEEIEAASRPGMVPTRGYAAAIEGGMLRRMVLSLANGQRTATDFVPMGQGVSVRLITFPAGPDPGQVTAVFNRAVVGADGIVLVETWLRRPGEARPAYNFYRLRCGPGGPGK